MPVFALDEQYVMFPDPEMANSDGLLALGGKLTPEWLILAYEMGIFPWFNEGDPILWWSVDPRSVLFPAEVHVSKSMRPYLNSEDYTFSFDTAFEEVIRHCSEAPGRGTKNTWITEEILDAYLMLHDIGLAHSVEIREKSTLVGGLYGVSLGKAFFGESMFSLKNNMSKLAFIRLAENLARRGFHFIDCQVHTKHLERLGAQPIPRKAFLTMLHNALLEETEKGTWTT